MSITIMNTDFEFSAETPIEVIHARHEMPTVGRPQFDMHYPLELGVVLQGKMNRWIGDHTTSCQAGSVWCCGMWEPHGFEVVSSCEVMVAIVWPPLLMTPEMSGNFDWMAPFVLPHLERPDLTGERRVSASALAREMLTVNMRMGEATGAVESMRLRLLFFQILLLLLEEMAQGGDIQQKFAPEHARIVPALEMVFRVRTLITNDEAADACGLSRDRFLRLFKRLMGESFATFALLHRLGHAKLEVSQGEKPLKAIARDWGFTDQSHFHRVFVKYLGCTPAVYRQHLD